MGIFGRGKGGRHHTDEYADEYQDEQDEYGDEYGDADDYDEYAEYEQDDEVEDDEFEDDGGPYDVETAPDDGLPRIDLGSVRLAVPDGAQIQVEMDPNGALRAVHVVTPNGRHTLGAYAAPRSSALWSEVARELSDQLHSDGARIRRENGPWGIELVAFVNEVLLRFVGVDGPRWMLRAVAAGPKELSAKAAEELRNLVNDAVVVRGEHPMPVRTPLPLTLPPDIAEHVAQQMPNQGQAGQAS